VEIHWKRSWSTRRSQNLLSSTQRRWKVWQYSQKVLGKNFWLWGRKSREIGQTTSLNSLSSVIWAALLCSHRKNRGGWLWGISKAQKVIWFGKSSSSAEGQICCRWARQWNSLKSSFWSNFQRARTLQHHASRLQRSQLEHLCFQKEHSKKQLRYKSYAQKRG